MKNNALIVLLLVFISCNKINDTCADIGNVFIKNKLLSNKISHIETWKIHKNNEPHYFRYINNRILFLDVKGRIFEVLKDTNNIRLLLNSPKNYFMTDLVDIIDNKYLVTVWDENYKSHLAYIDKNTRNIDIIRKDIHPRTIRLIKARNELWYTDDENKLYINKNDSIKMINKKIRTIDVSDDRIILEDIESNKFFISDINRIDWKVVDIYHANPCEEECMMFYKGINKNNIMIFLKVYPYQSPESKHFKNSVVFIYDTKNKRQDLLEGDIMNASIFDDYIITIRKVFEYYYMDMYKLNVQ